MIDRIHAVVDPIALKLVKWLNWLAGIIAAGITGFTALHPNFPAEVQTTLGLTAFQGMLFGMAWCSFVAWLVRRAAESAS